MNRFKPGQRVRCIGGCSEGEIVTVNSCDDSRVSFVTDGGHACYLPINNFETIEKTLDNLEVGDVLGGYWGGTRYAPYMVAGVAGMVVFIVDKNGDIEYKTVGKLKKKGVTVKGPEPADDTVELTLEEVAQLKGIPVDKLRIKEKD